MSHKYGERHREGKSKSVEEGTTDASEPEFNFRDLERWVGNEMGDTRLSYYMKHEDYELFLKYATEYIFGLYELDITISTHERYHTFVKSLFDFFLQNFKRGFGKRVTKTKWEEAALSEQIETSKRHFDRLFGEQQAEKVERNVDKYLKRAFNQCLSKERDSNRRGWDPNKMKLRWMELIKQTLQPSRETVWDQVYKARNSFKNMEVAYNTMLYNQLITGYSDFYNFKMRPKNNDDNRSQENTPRDDSDEGSFPGDLVGIDRKNEYKPYKEKLTEKLTVDELKQADEITYDEARNIYNRKISEVSLKPEPFAYKEKGGDKRKSRKRTRRRRKRKKYSKKSNRKLKKKSRKRKRKKRTRRRRRRR